MKKESHLHSPFMLLPPCPSFSSFISESDEFQHRVFKRVGIRYNEAFISDSSRKWHGYFIIVIAALSENTRIVMLKKSNKEYYLFL